MILPKAANQTLASVLVVAVSCALFLLPVASAQLNFTIFEPTDTVGEMGCAAGKRPFEADKHKSLYKVGVHATGGFGAAERQFSLLFSDYLTATAGQRFDPPVTFQMVPADFEGLMEAVEEEDVDFFFAAPGAYSCIGVEIGAEPLATIIARVNVRGKIHELDVYGGVMATRKDNREINSIEDFKDKVVAAGGIDMILAGQVQFYEMARAGLSYVMDPAQVVFTNNQFDVVKGVLSGEFDVGFVRTDQIERTRDEDGEFVDPDDFKIVSPRINVMDDGTLFPFLHSTDIYPERMVAALPHVHADVALEVQQALLAFSSHEKIGLAYLECEHEDYGIDCETATPRDFDPHSRCDTTQDLAMLAGLAAQSGKFAGFRTPRSNFQTRTMHEKAGFLIEDENGDWKCTRSSNLYEGIQCPAGHVKRNIDEFEIGCDLANRTCGEGYDCFCKPCIYEVDLYHVPEGEEDVHLDGDYFREYPGGCLNMELCGSAYQTETITYRLYDNKERKKPDIRVVLRTGDTARDLPVNNVKGTFAYDFSFAPVSVGEILLEVYFDNEQIPASPVRVEVVERDCGEDRVAGEDGQCKCAKGSLEMLGGCVNSTIFFVCMALLVGLIALAVGLKYIAHKREKSDQVWHIQEEELSFDEPPEVIGQGGFGEVLLAEYRGTKVAIKRVFPLPKRGRRGSRGGGSRSGSRSGSRDAGSRDASKDAASRGASKEGMRVQIQEMGAETECSDATPPPSNEEDPENPKSLEDKMMLTGTIGGTASGVSLNTVLDRIKNRSSRRSKWWLPTNWFQKEEQYGHRNILASSSGTSSIHQTTMASLFCPCLSKQARQKEEFVAEMRLLSRLRHPNITTIMGAVISPFQEPVLVMEYMDYGSLYDLLRNETMYAGGDIILQITKDIVSGIQFLHANKPPILHGDLKAKNILVDSRFRAKVGDFGLSATKKKKGVAGTAFWLAPEYLRGRDYTTACDMYSFGVILFEIYAREIPYKGENPITVLAEICDTRRNKRPKVPAACPPRMVSLMKKCWATDPSARPHAKDLHMLLLDVTAAEADPVTGDNQHCFKTVRSEIPTEDMLSQIFPPHIADALKAGRKVEPENHELVSLFFSDVVNFTTISQSLSPMKVSSLLDRLYLLFDSMAKKHDIFKVETIGDAYMGVTNLNKKHPNDHAKRIAEFAIDVVAAASQVKIDEDDPESDSIRIRVGIHSGPVVSNVIGSLNPRYGLFGDSVNTAARMETNSSAGRIHCSERSAMLLAEQAPEITVKKRGTIVVKGKGEMVTYWITADSVPLKA